MSDDNAMVRLGQRHGHVRRKQYRLATLASGEGHVDDLVAGYALGALDPDETARLEDHVLTCDACARDVEESRRTTALLALTAPSATPPPDVKVALFARIAQSQAQTTGTAPVAGLRPALARTWSSPVPFLPALTTTIPASRPMAAAFAPAGGLLPARPSRRGRTISAGVTGTLVVAVGLLSMWSMILRDNAESQADQINDLRSQLTEGGFSSLGGTTGGDGSSVSPTGDVADGLGWVINPSGTDQGSLLVVSGIEDQGDGVDYDVYAVLRDSGQFVPAGGLRVDASGTGTTTMDLAWGRDYAQLCVAARGSDPADRCQVLRSTSVPAPAP
ncbi:MAG: zf-HC2 domain-containing protein [Chloroflexota bacterium]|nr:zf-HC2 domain-containing protein [Chloroflexota bacterium]